MGSALNRYTQQLFNVEARPIRGQTLISVSVFVFGMWLAWQLAQKIVANDMRSLEMIALGCLAGAVFIATMRDWRTGFYIFIIWLVFEDLVRKYMGNGLAFFFGKDILFVVILISFFVSFRRGQEKLFRPQFLLWLGLFGWLAAIQIFNPNSPHILYGLLGFKLYFYYVPLLFIGYSFIRTKEDLRKFLVINVGLGCVIAALGIAQAILGNWFLNPSTLPPDLQLLGNLNKTTPLSNQILSLPDSVFVSSGRFGEYLIIGFILTFSAVAYFLVAGHRHRKLSFMALAVLAGASLFSGSRGCVVYVFASALMMAAIFMWGAPLKGTRANKLSPAIRRSFVIAGIGLTILLFIFPEQAASRLAYYRETLDPNSPAYEFVYRSWTYPMANLKLAFSSPNWLFGNGTGTASLGTQYIARLVRVRPLGVDVEEGYGTLIAEMGILAPILWILWTTTLLRHSWGVVRRLRQTQFFPLAFGFFWFAFLLLFPLTFAGMAPYQNYICNVYLWLLIGLLFRLPDLQPSSVVATKALAQAQNLK